MPLIVPSQVVDLIDQTFPAAKNAADTGGGDFAVGRSHAPFCAALIDLVRDIPPELLTISGQTYTEYISSVAAIKNALDQWQVRIYNLVPLPGLTQKNPIVLIRLALAKCPDEFPSTDTAYLDFITDADLKMNLKTDISATNKALSNGEWKAATVLAGSVVEALLLWALKQRKHDEVMEVSESLVKEKILTARPNNSLDKWDLHTFTEVAAKLVIISPETTSQIRLAREFRNLIHPGREVRLKQKCDRATALSAVAAVEHTIREFK